MLYFLNLHLKFSPQIFLFFLSLYIQVGPHQNKLS